MHVNIHLSKPSKCTIPILNPKGNYKLQVIRTYLYRFISCNKCTSLVRDIEILIMRVGAMHVDVGGRLWSTWKISIPSSQFCGEPKTILKKKKSWNTYSYAHIHVHAHLSSLETPVVESRIYKNQNSVHIYDGKKSILDKISMGMPLCW